MTLIPRAEHPRPDRVRTRWATLNGAWSFAFDGENRGKREKWYRGHCYDQAIAVPFCYQSELSGIADKAHCDIVWYERDITVPRDWLDGRVLLHFGAVDYRADVWLDGQYLGNHEGGYTPFSFDITELVTDGAMRLTVRAEDRLDFDQPRGKQSFRPEPFECWYTPVTGIWQTVWLEGVGACYPTDVRLTPHIEQSAIEIEISLNELPKDGGVRLTASFEGKTVARQEIAVTSDRSVRTKMYLNHNERLEGVHFWRPGNPKLYDLTVETLSGGAVSDTLQTYFGMRKIEVSGNHVLLNNNVLYQRLVLDQGYWRDGLLTAPSDDALRHDVEMTLKMGYNGARKHQKFEDPRYLYWADKLGLLVWGELPSAYWLRDSQKRNLMRDMREAIARDYSHPCLIAWVPINESWGVPFIQTDKESQALADALYAMIHSLDGTRPVSGNDGWEQANTDFVTVHDYTARPDQLKPDYQSERAILEGAPGSSRLVSARGYAGKNAGKPMLLTEYGGIAMQRDAGGVNWGYNGAVSDEKSFLARFEAITKAFRDMPGFCGYCYTQLTDVFQEVNGLLDMDRQPKASVEEIARINRG